MSIGSHPFIVGDPQVCEQQPVCMTLWSYDNGHREEIDREIADHEALDPVLSRPSTR